MEGLSYFNLSVWCERSIVIKRAWNSRLVVDQLSLLEKEIRVYIGFFVNRSGRNLRAKQIQVKTDAQGHFPGGKVC